MQITLNHRGLLEKSGQAMIANFHQADAIAQRGFRRVVIRNADRVVRLTKAHCPVDTRWMQNHVRYELSPSGLIANIGWFADDFLPYGLAFYPPFVEFGTSRMAAQPSLYPALAISEPSYLHELRDVANASLARINRNR